MESQPQTAGTAKIDIAVRQLQERDLAAADHIMRMAFGTLLGLPEPAAFMGDASQVRPRWFADPTAAFGAEVAAELIGSNFATNWGSVGFFGPLTIRPDLWDRGFGKRLMEPIMECFAKWGTKQVGLLTFPHSQKHIGFYQRFGFWPRFLTAVMSKPIEQRECLCRWSRFSELPETEREACLKAARELTESIYEGLDVGREIVAVAVQKLGETVLLWDDSRLVGLAVCHYGPGTEAGSSVCYVKFGAVRSEPAPEQLFGHLLDASEQMAAAQGLSRLVAGVNTARYEAYRQVLARGCHIDFQGIAMQRPNEPGYNRQGVYLIDDWR
jgi:GNAT superfamily N-acetyltransferase